MYATHTLRRGGAVWITTLVLASTPVPALAQDKPTEIIAECIYDAWADNVACQTNGSWLDDLGCAVKFLIDSLVCTVKPLQP